jgi:hypothetical protein
MKAADAWPQFLAAAGRRTFGLGRDLAHCRNKE